MEASSLEELWFDFDLLLLSCRVGDGVPSFFWVALTGPAGVLAASEEVRVPKKGKGLCQRVPPERRLRQDF